MAGDKDAAKRRRQARNRQEREKRQQRTEAARRPSRTADPAPSLARKAGKGTKGTASSKAPAASGGADAASSPKGGGLLGTLFPPRPQPAGGAGGRPSRAQPMKSVPVDVGEVEGVRGAYVSFSAQPGGRAALFALLMAVAAGVMVFTTATARLEVLDGLGRMAVEASHPDADVVAGRLERFGDADPVLTNVFVVEILPVPVVIVLALVPVAITAFAVSALTKPTRSRTLLIASLLAALYYFFAGQFNPAFVFSVFALGWAAWKSRKADVPVAAGDGEDDEDG